jgi:hypothetical protein
MGFSVPYRDNRVASILPDVTCDMMPVEFAAIELLDYVDEPCFTGSIDEIELEIDKGTPAPSARALIEDILGRSRDVGPWPADLLEQSETDVAVIEPNLETVGTASVKALVESIVGHSIDAAPALVGWSGVSATNVAENKQDLGIASMPSGRALVESIVGHSISTYP